MSPNHYDTRDSQEHTDVAMILGVLPEEHPARAAYARGVGTLELTHFVADRLELVEGRRMRGSRATGKCSSVRGDFGPSGR